MSRLSVAGALAAAAISLSSALRSAGSMARTRPRARSRVRCTGPNRMRIRRLTIRPRAAHQWRTKAERVLRTVCDVDVAETLRRDHAASLARDAVDAGYDVVTVLAGDGTLNEAGGGLAGSQVALAALPGACRRWVALV